MTDYTLPTIGSTSWGGPLNDVLGEIDADMQVRALDADVVHATGDEAIAGVKTFASAPVVPNASFSIAKVIGLQGELDGLAGSMGGVTEVNAITGAVELVEGDNITLTVDTDLGTVTIDAAGGDHVGAGANSILLGTSATAAGTSAVAVGKTSTASGPSTVAVGEGSVASASSATAVGLSATASATYTTAIGTYAQATTSGAVAVGEAATSSGSDSIALGADTTSDGADSIAVGSGSFADSSSSAAFGSSAFATHDSSTALGVNAETTAVNQIMLGTSAETVTIPGKLNVATATPASAGATGVAGTIAWDASYIYVCTATNTWKRTAISTW